MNARHYKKRRYQRRGGQPHQRFPGRQGIGTFQCNVCFKNYTRYSVHDRFCSPCRSKL